MSLKAKIEAVIYASEEPVTPAQLVSLLGGEAQGELDAADALQGQLDLLVEPDRGAQEREPLQGEAGREADPSAALRDDNDEREGQGVYAAPDAAGSAETADRAETGGSVDTAATAETADFADTAGFADAGAFADTAGFASAAAFAETAGIADTAGFADAGAFAGTAASADASLATAVASPETEPSAAELRARERRLREYMRSVLDGLIAEYRDGDRGLEIREIAGGFRFATKPEYHDAVRGFVRSLKPPLKLSLQALETLAVVAYKQPVTAPEISEIRGVDSGGVLGSLMTRKLITTAGRKQVIGRPILYKTTKEFLLRFGLKDLSELPSIEEFERLASDMNEAVQEEIPMPQSAGESPVVPIGEAADSRRLTPEDVAREVEPSRGEHTAQADGDPNASIPTADEVDAERLSPATEGPGEFTGDETVPPAENTVIDGRLSGLPPSYDNQNNSAADSPAKDAMVQAGQDGQDS